MRPLNYSAPKKNYRLKVGRGRRRQYSELLDRKGKLPTPDRKAPSARRVLLSLMRARNYSDPKNNYRLKRKRGKSAAGFGITRPQEKITGSREKGPPARRALSSVTSGDELLGREE